jgi:purine-binding chemotaxis protein CheW
MTGNHRERPDPNKSLVGFVVGTVVYAVPIAAVREIINPTSLTALPHLPRGVVGVAGHRGEVIPVVDLRGRFGLGPAEDVARIKWILVDVGTGTVGLVVDRVTEVFGTGSEALREVPRLGHNDDVRGISGVVSYDGHLVFVLDVESFERLVESVPQDALQLMAGESEAS